MPEHDAGRHPVRIGEWTAHPSLNEVVRGDERVRLEPKAMQALMLLASRPGGVWSRQELMEEVWRDTVVGDETLTRIISNLRQVFGDSSRDPRYIATVYKKGYRLIADVEVPAVAEVEPVGESPTSPDPAPSPRSEPPSRRRRAPWIVAAVVVVVAAIVVMRGWRTEPPVPVTMGELTVRPVTTLAGGESSPAMSPDGSRVAFVWREPETDDTNLWIKDLATDSLSRATEGPGVVTTPTWSPDGKCLAYVHAYAAQTIRISAGDGTGERAVAYPSMPVQRLDWSPDGDTLVYNSAATPRGQATIKLLSVTAGAERPLHAVPVPGHQLWPAASPDGRRIAYVRRDDAGRETVIVAEIEGSTRPIATLDHRCQGLDWFPDGRRLVISTAVDEDHELFELRLDDGAMTRLPIRSRNALAPSMATTAGRLAYVEAAHDTDIWVQGPGPGDGLRRLFSSTRDDALPKIAPDGQRVAFLSDRTGHTEIWLAAVDGSGVRRLTRFDGPWLSGLRWRQDGATLLVTAHREGRRQRTLVDLATGDHRPLAGANAVELGGIPSRDGRHAYYFGPGGPTPELRRRDLQTGDDQQVLAPGRSFLGEDVARDAVIFVPAGTNEVWRLDLETGAETRLLDPVLSMGWHRRQVTPHGLMFQVDLAEFTALGRYDLATDAVDTLLRVPPGSLTAYDISPDGRLILVALREDLGQDIALIEGLAAPGR